MDYSKLKAELADDPASIGYSAMTNAEASAAINASTQPARQLVPLWQIKKRLIETGVLLAIQAAAETESQIQAAARLTIEYIDDDRFEHLDMDLDSTKQMVGALIAGGVVSSDLSAELDAMAATTTSRAAILGIERVEPGHVESARRMMEVQL